MLERVSIPRTNITQELPPFLPEWFSSYANRRNRNILSQQMRKLRKIDQASDYINGHKNKYKYSDHREHYYLRFLLGGLSETVNQAKETLLEKEKLTWLDIGSGYSKIGILRNEYYPGAHLIATNLARKGSKEESHEQLLGLNASDELHITPVERLSRISDHSVDLITATHSLMYSMFPHIAVESIDRVLKPGGIIKMVNVNSIGNEIWSQLEIKGYDIGIGVEFDPIVKQWITRILAIKPPFLSRKAEEIIRKDASTLSSYLTS